MYSENKAVLARPLITRLRQDVQDGELVTKGELCRVAGGENGAGIVRHRDVGPGSNSLKVIFFDF